VVGAVVDLQKIRGLKPATDQIFKLDAPRWRVNWPRFQRTRVGQTLVANLTMLMAMANTGAVMAIVMRLLAQLSRCA